MTSASEPLVSVLTPVYNGEKYLAECVESVLAQTYRNWEYTIVNNCSTDRSLEIANAYARRDSRIRVHSNDKLVGVMRNHNICLSRIDPASKYCKFVQCDDWLYSDCIRQMVALAEENPTIGIVSAYRLEGVKVNLDGLPYTSTVLSGRDVCKRRLLGDRYLFGTPTSLLMRCDLIRKREVFYDESHVHSDNAACFDVLQESDFGFVHQVLTYSRVRDEAITTHARKINSTLLSGLGILLRYGPVYLSEKEFQECLDSRLAEYYIFLGRAIFERRGKDFWKFHEDGLRNLGFPLSRRRLVMPALLELAKIVATGSGSRLVRLMRESRSKPRVRPKEYLAAQNTPRAEEDGHG